MSSPGVVVNGGDGDTLVKNRFLGFLIWQSVQSTLVFFFTKALLLSSFIPSLPGFLSFLVFHFSTLLFSTSLALVASPQPHRPASPSELAFGLVRFVFVSGAAQELPADFRRRARVSLAFFLFVAASAASAFLSILSLCWNCDPYAGMSWSHLMQAIGFRGFAVGFFYGLYYLYTRRWITQFPIIQRPPFFSFKMGLPSAIRQTLKLSSTTYLFSAVLALFLSNEAKYYTTVGKFFAEQIIFYVGSFMVLLCLELSRQLYQVLHTKRCIFAPPKGSAAAETNPSEPLLAVLEESTPKSLLQHLAYLDLRMVCESNVDIWRRAAFFEETGETYNRVIGICLKPLKQFTSKLSEGLDCYSIDKSFQVSHQLQSPTDPRLDLRLDELFHDFQLCAWCARIAGALTVHSHKEDRFGVAQLTGSNADVVSTLLSCLLAVETFMGKKTNLQSSDHLMGPAGIKWATLGTRKEVAVGVMEKRRGSPQYSVAYAMADIVRTSIYNIVSNFHDEMLTSSKTGLLEKDWIISSKPLHATREVLSQKLRTFLDFRAS